MSPDPRRANDSYVRSFYFAVRDAESGLETVPALLSHVIHTEVWRERVVGATDELVYFHSFVDFLEASPPYGIGTTTTILRRLCQGDDKALSLLETVLVDPSDFTPSTEPLEPGEEIARTSTGEFVRAQLGVPPPPIKSRHVWIVGDARKAAAALQARFPRRFLYQVARELLADLAKGEE